LSDGDRGKLQLAAALVDLLEQVALVAGIGEHGSPSLHLLAQQREVVIVAEVIGEIVCLIRQISEQVLVGAPDQPQLVPEVLDPLAELVQVGDAGFLFHRAQSLSPPPVGPMQAGCDQLPAVPLQREELDPGSPGGQLRGGTGHRPLDRAVVVGRPVLFVELPAEGIEATSRRRPEPLTQPIERLDQDLSVPEAAQGPGGLPVVVVLAAPEVVSDRIADEAERRADLLDVLPRLMDRVGGLRVGFAA
jgi:hypothetical protein